MKNLILDLDGTLTFDKEGKDYIDKKLNTKVIEKLKEYKKGLFG